MLVDLREPFLGEVLKAGRVVGVEAEQNAVDLHRRVNRLAEQQTPRGIHLELAKDNG